MFGNIIRIATTFFVQKKNRYSTEIKLYSAKCTNKIAIIKSTVKIATNVKFYFFYLKYAGHKKK